MNVEIPEDPSSRKNTMKHLTFSPNQQTNRNAAEPMLEANGPTIKTEPEQEDSTHIPNIGAEFRSAGYNQVVEQIRQQNLSKLNPINSHYRNQNSA